MRRRQTTLTSCRTSWRDQSDTGRRTAITEWLARWRKSKRKGIPPFYFLHIPKTAGTSITSWLLKQLGESAVCPARIWDQLVRLEARDLQGYRAFSGHFGVNLAQFLNAKLISATVFRDPVARTRSHYGHVLRDTAHPHHSYVRRQSFQAFVQDENNWPMIENFQARYLLATPVRFQDLHGHLDNLPSKTSRLSVLSEDARYLFDKTYVREKSAETVSKLDVVGVTENLPAFFSAVTKIVSASPATDGHEIPTENVAAPQDDRFVLDGRTTDIMMRLTTLDQELYGMACLKAAYKRVIP